MCVCMYFSMSLHFNLLALTYILNPRATMTLKFYFTSHTSTFLKANSCTSKFGMGYKKGGYEKKIDLCKLNLNIKMKCYQATDCFLAMIRWFVYRYASQNFTSPSTYPLYSFAIDSSLPHILLHVSGNS